MQQDGHQEKAAAAAAAAPAAADPKGKARARLTAKEKALVREFERKELSPAEAEARRLRLKNLIVLGKERGYLTYAEVNDHLPDDMLDAEQIESVISMINDMGIQVYDEAPDAETLLMNEATPAVAPGFFSCASVGPNCSFVYERAEEGILTGWISDLHMPLRVRLQ